MSGQFAVEQLLAMFVNQCAFSATKEISSFSSGKNEISWYTDYRWRQRTQCRAFSVPDIRHKTWLVVRFGVVKKSTVHVVTITFTLIGVLLARK